MDVAEEKSILGSGSRRHTNGGPTAHPTAHGFGRFASLAFTQKEKR